MHMLDTKFDLDPDKGKLSWPWLGLYLTSNLRGPYTDECSLHAVHAGVFCSANARANVAIMDVET